MKRAAWGVLIVCAVTACGGDDGASGEPDAGPINMGTCGVNVELYNRAEVPTWSIVFSRPDGSEIGVESLEATGAASRPDCVDDTIITIAGSTLFWETVAFEQVSYFGVAPGTTVDFDPVRQFDESAISTIQVSLDHGSPVAGATSYAGSLGCKSVPFTAFNDSQVVMVEQRCVTNASYSILVAARDSLGNPLKFDFAKSTQAAMLSLNNWRDPIGVDVILDNAPAEQLGLSSSALVGDQTFFSAGAANPAVDAGQALATLFATPTGFADKLAIGASATSSPAVRNMVAYVDQQATATLDGADFLPKLTSLELDTGDTARPSLSWTADGDLTGADFAAFKFYWRNQPADVPNRVYVIAPTTMSSVQLPTLPADLTFHQIPSAAMFSDVGGQAIDVDVPGGYQEVIADNRVNAVIHAEQSFFPPNIDYRSTGR